MTADLIRRSDAPERLWLWPEDPEDGGDKWVSFPDQPYPSGSTEYIRADLATCAPVVPAEGLEGYDAGLLNDFGGGDVGWWQDYLRAEIGRANEFWREQVENVPALRSTPPVGARVSWIDTADQRPPKDQPFLARNPGFAAFIAEWSETDQEYLTYVDVDGWCRILFSHWMPIPDLSADLLSVVEEEEE